MSLTLIFAVILGVGALGILAEIWLKRATAPRPLAHRMRNGMKETVDTQTPLGMEATDLESVRRAQKLSEISSLKSKDVRFK